MGNGNSSKISVKGVIVASSASQANPLPKLDFHFRKPVASFRGRDEELQMLLSWFFTEHKKMAVISGLPGYGKTELARRFADFCKERELVHSVLWLDAETPSALEESFRELLRCLGASDKAELDVRSVVQVVHQHFSNEPHLFVFDNAPDRWSVFEFEPKGAGLCLCISHVQDWGDDVPSLSLAPLSMDAAVDVLRAVLQHRFQDKDLEEYKHLAELLSRVPLALQVAAAYVKQEIDDLNEDFRLSDYIIERRNTSFISYLITKIPYTSSLLYDNSIYESYRNILRKIEDRKDDISKLSLSILNICAYLKHDKIYLSELENFSMLSKTNEKELKGALQLIENFLFIKIAHKRIIINKLVQSVLMLYQSLTKDHHNPYYISCLEYLAFNYPSAHSNSILKVINNNIASFKIFHKHYESHFANNNEFLFNLIETEEDTHEALRWLVEHGAHIDAVGRTLVHVAALVLSPHIIPRLVAEFDLDVNAVDKNEQTPLHLLSLGISNGDVERRLRTAECLLKLGARLSEDIWGRTPIEEARLRGFDYLADYLQNPADNIGSYISQLPLPLTTEDNHMKKNNRLVLENILTKYEIKINEFRLPALKNTSVSRQCELDELLSIYFVQRCNIVIICGLPEVGKSELTNNFARLCIDNNMIDKVFWMNAHTEETLQESFRDVAKAMNINLENLERYIYERLDCYRCLFIFHGARSRENIKKYEPLSQNHFLLITSENIDWNSNPVDSVTIELQPLSLDFALDIYRGILKQYFRVEDMERYEELANIINFTPLGLRITAAHIYEEMRSFTKKFDLQTYLNSIKNKIGKSFVINAYSKSLNICIEMWLNQISNSTDYLFSNITLHTLHLLLYFSPKYVSLEILLKTLSHVEELQENNQYNKEVVRDTIRKLHNYSLILYSTDKDDFVINISETVEQILKADFYTEFKYYKLYLKILLKFGIEFSIDIFRMKCEKEYRFLNYLVILQHADTKPIIFSQFYDESKNILNNPVNREMLDHFLSHLTMYGCEQSVKKILDNVNDYRDISKFNLLYTAIRYNQLRMVKYFIENHRLDVNYRNNYGNMPMHIAASHCNLDAMELLIQHDANTQSGNNLGNIPLFELLFGAQNNENVDINKVINLFLLHLIPHNINIQNHKGDTLLHAAVFSLKKEFVELLIDKSIDVNIVNIEGKTPLDILMYFPKTTYDSQKIVTIKNILIKNKATNGIKQENVLKYKNVLTLVDLTKNCFYKYNLLHKFISNNQIDSLRDSLRQYKIKHSVNDDFNTLLHVAAYCGNLDAIYLLIQNGANINILNRDFKTPLYEFFRGARDYKHIHSDEASKIIDALKCNIKFYNEEPLLHIATMSFQPILVKLLIAQLNINVNKLDSNKRTALHKLISELTDDNIQKYLMKICKTIMQLKLNGAVLPSSDMKKIIPSAVAQNSNIKSIEIFLLFEDKYLTQIETILQNFKGHVTQFIEEFNLLHYAAAYNQTEILKLLLTFNVDVNCRDDRQCTALHLAAFYSNTVTIEILIQNKADVNERNNQDRTAEDYINQRIQCSDDKYNLHRYLYDFKNKINQSVVNAHNKSLNVCVEMLLNQMSNKTNILLSKITLHTLHLYLYFSPKNISLEILFKILSNIEELQTCSDYSIQIVQDVIRQLYNCFFIIYFPKTDSNDIIITIIKQTLHTYFNMESNYYKTYLNILLKFGYDFCNRISQMESTAEHVFLKLLTILQYAYVKHKIFSQFYHENKTTLHDPVYYKMLHQILTHLTIYGCVESVEEILDDLNNEYISKFNLLHTAIHYNQLNLCNIFITKRKMDTNQVNEDGNTPMHVAASECNFDAMKLLVECGPNINIKNNAGNTALFEFFRGARDCEKIYLDEASKIIDALKYNEDVEEEDPLLHIAAMSFQPILVKLLIAQCNINVNKLDSNMRTALHKLISEMTDDHIHKYLMRICKTIMQLKIKGAVLHTSDIRQIIPPAVAQNPNIKCIEIFLLFEDKYLTQIETILQNFSSDVKTFIEEFNLLHYAAACNQIEILKLLLFTYNVDVNCKDDRQRTALHLAAYYCNIETIQILINHNNSDVTIRNNQDRTAVDYFFRGAAEVNLAPEKVKNILKLLKL